MQLNTNIELRVTTYLYVTSTTQLKEVLLQVIKHTLTIQEKFLGKLKNRTIILHISFSFFSHETNKIIETKEEDLADLKVNLAAIDEKLKTAEEELKAKNDIFKEGTK